jgi:2'-5' RNA ligase
MSDREYYKRRAAAERSAAQASRDSTSFVAHMTLAREYDWLAVTEPYPDTDAPAGGQGQGAHA